MIRIVSLSDYYEEVQLWRADFKYGSIQNAIKPVLRLIRIEHFWTRTPNHQLGKGNMIDEPLNEMGLMRMQILQPRGSSNSSIIIIINDEISARLRVSLL